MIHTFFINTNNNTKLHFRPGIRGDWKVVKRLALTELQDS